MNGEMLLFDLQTVAFWVLKNAIIIAETVTLGFTLLLNPTAPNCGDKM
jgi:hypothetical protein